MFSINSANDFLQKTNGDFDAFMQDIADAGLAMNAFLAIYHLHEWTWARWLKQFAPTCIRGQMVADKKSFTSWLERHCPHFNLIQDIANGAKHCRPVNARKVSGYGAGPYGVGPFGKPYLLIDLSPQAPKRYFTAHSVIKDAQGFWNAFFEEFKIAEFSPV